MTTIDTGGNRIYFAGNPWPEGHAINTFDWTAKRVDGDLWFEFHLQSAQYDHERKIVDDEDTDYNSEWEAPSVWTNYGRSTMSATQWHAGGFKVCPIEDFSMETLDGMTFEIDAGSDPGEEYPERAFHIYLLGHDAVVDHRIHFKRIGDSTRFDILWSGKIALIYVGDDTPKYRFEARLHAVECPGIPALQG